MPTCEWRVLALVIFTSSTACELSAHSPINYINSDDSAVYRLCPVHNAASNCDNNLKVIGTYCLSHLGAEIPWPNFYSPSKKR